jgi:inositol 2-dehydrogenase
MRLAVIGLGRMGRFYAQAVATRVPNARLTAVVDPDPATRRAVQSRFGVEHAFPEPIAALERHDVDAVIVATPTVSHAEIVIAAADAGKAVFCEKPLALTVAQTRMVQTAAQRAGVLLQVGFMRRFDADYQRARELIESGQIGRPLTFAAVGRDPSCPPLEYADPAHSGGLLVDMGIHDFDLARWMMSSEVQRVSAQGGVLVYDQLREVGDVDTALVTLRFASGALGSIDMSRTACYGYDIRAEVVGTEGAVRVGWPAAAAHDREIRAPVAPPADDDETPHFVRRFDAAYRAQIEAFVACVRNDQPPPISGQDALAAIQIAEAAREALESGQLVDVPAE